jgi:hypothetical protein
VDDEVIKGIVEEGDLAQLAKLYLRIERLCSIIAGKDFMKMEKIEEEDLVSQATKIAAISVYSDNASEGPLHLVTQ